MRNKMRNATFLLVLVMFLALVLTTQVNLVSAKKDCTLRVYVQNNDDDDINVDFYLNRVYKESENCWSGRKTHVNNYAVECKKEYELKIKWKDPDTNGWYEKIKKKYISSGVKEVTLEIDRHGGDNGNPPKSCKPGVNKFENPKVNDVLINTVEKTGNRFCSEKSMNFVNYEVAWYRDLPNEPGRIYNSQYNDWWVRDTTAGYNFDKWEVHTCDYDSWRWDNCYNKLTAINCFLSSVNISKVNVLPSGTYKVGDNVPITYSIKNFGSETYSLYLGYSVRDETGRFWDAPYETVTIDSGSEITKTLLWKVPNNAEIGRYDVSIAVWGDKNGSLLANRLDTRVFQNSFIVEKTGYSDTSVNQYCFFTNCTNDPTMTSITCINGKLLCRGQKQDQPVPGKICYLAGCENQPGTNSGTCINGKYICVDSPEVQLIKIGEEAGKNVAKGVKCGLDVSADLICPPACVYFATQFFPPAIVACEAVCWINSLIPPINCVP